MFKPLLISVALTLAFANVQAATYYVSTSGNDSNNGSQTAPWRTVQKAANTIVAGDTANIAAGTYSENVTFSNSGSSGKPRSFVGTSATIAGNITFSGNYNTLSSITCSPPSVGAGYAVIIAGNYNTFNGCTVTKYGAAAADQATGIGLNGSFNSVTNCTVTNLTDIDAFHVFGHDHTISGCTVSKNTQANYSLNHTDLFQSWGLNGLTSYNIRWVNCRFLDSACQMGNSSNDGSSSLHDWTFVNCVWANISGPFFSGIPNTKFYNCLFYKCQGNPLDTPIAFYGITGYSSAGSEIVNCVFLACGSNPASASLGGIGSNGVSLSTLKIDTNYFAGTNYVAKNGAYIGTHPINGGNPKFVNETAYDFHLQTGSPLIGAGINLSSVFTQDGDGIARPASGGWDVGPYQFGSSSIGTTAPVAPKNLKVTTP